MKALFAFLILTVVSCVGCEGSHRTSSIIEPQVTHPQHYWTLVWSNERPRMPNMLGDHLTIEQRASTYQVAEFRVPTHWPPPPLHPKWLDVRAVYRLNGLGRLPVLGDTLRGEIAWYEWAQGRADTTYYYGRPLPDSIQVLGSSIKAYPYRREFLDVDGAFLGTATTLKIEATITLGGKSVGTWWNYDELAHQDSLWFFP